MILRNQENDYIYNPNELVPATYKNGSLTIGNNGISPIFFGGDPIECKDHPASTFQFFATSNPPMERAFFVSWNKMEYSNFISHTTIDEQIIKDPDAAIEMWEIFYVFSKRKVEPNGHVKKKELQYSCLRHCRPETLFCKCDDCGEYFVITPQTKLFYRDRGLVVPTQRCQKCIQKKRMRYAAKNK